MPHKEQFQLQLTYYQYDDRGRGSKKMGRRVYYYLDSYGVGTGCSEYHKVEDVEKRAERTCVL